MVGPPMRLLEFHATAAKRPIKAIGDTHVVFPPPAPLALRPTPSCTHDREGACLSDEKKPSPSSKNAPEAARRLRARAAAASWLVPMQGWTQSCLSAKWLQVRMRRQAKWTARSGLADTDTDNDDGDNDDHGDSWRNRITLHRQQRQQTHQSVAFLFPRELVRPHTSRVARGSHDDSPPVAGFRRASPEAHGLGSDSPACVGVPRERLGVVGPLQRQETTPAGATIRFQSTLHRAPACSPCLSCMQSPHFVVIMQACPCIVAACNRSPCFFGCRRRRISQ